MSMTPLEKLRWLNRISFAVLGAVLVVVTLGLLFVLGYLP